MARFKEMYFEVGSEEEAKALQEYLFSLGYSWALAGKEVTHLDKRVFATNEVGCIFYIACPEGTPRHKNLYKITFENKLAVKDIEKVNNDPFLYNDGSVIIPKGALVEVIYRDGYKRTGRYPCDCEGHKYKIESWEHSGDESDIIAYRILKCN